MSFTRSPIICLLAHVDHGKTSLLDAIRGTAVAKKEAGGITQMIGASYVSKEDIDEIAGNLASKMKVEIRIPGLLFIDTPGHEAFGNLRDRGGSLADLVILLVDVAQGFQPQTIESIKILKEHKTPFLLAANKIDLVHGWKSQKTQSFFESLSKQQQNVKDAADQKLYELMGAISEHGFDSERFDRVTDFTKQIGIVPISAKTGEGLSELLVLISGLSQRFLGKDLEVDPDGRGKGSILEVKDEKGLGPTLDVIVYDGVLKKNDEIIFLTQEGSKTTKIRGILVPNIGGKEKFKTVDSVVAAAGVKIHAPDLDGAIPGSPLEVVKDLEEDRKAIEAQLRSIIFQKDDLGVIVRADSLGSVEAILRLFEKEGIKIKDASVGHITRREVISARVVSESDPFLGVVLGFNVKVLDDAKLQAKDDKISILTSDIVYRLIDDYRAWVKSEKDRMKKESAAKRTWPGKIKVLDGYIFRASKPAVFGVDVLGGKLKTHIRLMNKSGEIVGEIREIQKEKEKVDSAEQGDQLAISCEGIHIGKNVSPGEILYSYMTLDEVNSWEKDLQSLTDPEKQLFEEIRRLVKVVF